MIFIRPWFLLLLFAPVLLWLFKGKLHHTQSLSKFVDAHLLPFVTVHFGGIKSSKKSFFLVFVWSVLVIAGSGPAFEKVSVPARVSAPNTVIVLDMSPAMNGEVLEQTKRKLYDLLEKLKGHQVGLVLYDDKGYVVSPLTQDINIIRTMIPALNASVMPALGQRADLGFEKANELLKNINAKDGQIVFMTVGGFETQPLKKAAAKISYDIASIGFGKAEGIPVPLPNGQFLKNKNGSLALIKLDESVLKSIGDYAPAALDESDISALLKQSVGNDLEYGAGEDKTTEVWRDFGPVLLLLIAPFFAFLFRRGVLFILVMSFSFSASAGLFLRSDQEVYINVKEGIHAYRMGDYEKANKAFSTWENANAYYNKGNALAHLNDIQGAIDSYDKALSLEPVHADAKFNKAYLEKQLPPPQESAQSDKNQEDKKEQQSDKPAQENQSADSQNEHSKAPPPLENKGQGEQQPQPQSSQEQRAEQEQSNASTEQSGQQSQSNPQNINQPQSSDMTQENAPKTDVNAEQNVEPSQAQDTPKETKSLPLDEQNAQEAKPTEQPLAQESEPSSEVDQASQQLLNRIKQDPSRLLRYRLYQQWRQQNEQI